MLFLSLVCNSSPPKGIDYSSKNKNKVEEIYYYANSHSWCVITKYTKLQLAFIKDKGVFDIKNSSPKLFNHIFLPKIYPKCFKDLKNDVKPNFENIYDHFLFYFFRLNRFKSFTKHELETTRESSIYFLELNMINLLGICYYKYLSVIMCEKSFARKIGYFLLILYKYFSWFNSLYQRTLSDEINTKIIEIGIIVNWRIISKLKKAYEGLYEKFSQHKFGRTAIEELKNHNRFYILQDENDSLFEKIDNII